MCPILFGGIMNKEETKLYMKKWFKEHPDNLKKSQKKYYEKNKEKRIKASREWQINNPDKIKEWNINHPNYIRDWFRNNTEKSKDIFKRYYQKNKHKRKAQRIANKAYPVSQICSVVGCNKIGERHHPNYNKPLEIIWLCRKHHKDLQNNINENYK